MRWTVLLLLALVLLRFAAALPAQNDIAKVFYGNLQAQSLHTILGSIEERLKNLDNIYTMHLSPTLEDKLEQYHRKLEAIDTKIIRLESLVMLNLDKIQENISTKNYKDDVARTNMLKKIDASYEAIGHRLGYMDRKFETNSNRIQNKLDVHNMKLEKMEEMLTSRDEDIESELSDAIAAIDDLKTTVTVMEDNIINATSETFEIFSNDQKKAKGLELVMTSVNATLIQIKSGVDSTENLIKSTRSELKEELNEYAVKVADMNSENWNSNKETKRGQSSLEKALNSTKIEMQNGVRALMVLLGKTAGKDVKTEDQIQMDRIHSKLDANFEKLYSAQSLFLDSCYRLQMDESQIEDKISDILEKLMETFDRKTAIELKDIKNLEKLIKTHDSRINRSLYQLSTNIETIYDGLSKYNQKHESDSKQTNDHLYALFSLVQDALAVDGNQNITKTIMDYEQKYFANISRILTGIEARINTGNGIQTSETTTLEVPTSTITNKNEITTVSGVETTTDDLEQYIRQIFGRPAAPALANTTEIVDSLDVRSNFDSDTETTTVYDE